MTDRVVLQAAEGASPLAHIWDGAEFDQSMIDKLLPPLAAMLVPTDRFDAGRRVVEVHLPEFGSETTSTGVIEDADPT